MAQSRLERIGTIFTRVTSLMKGGALKPDDKPLWYDLYAAFPPKLEPRYDRVAPNITVKDIFYKEDLIRARFHHEHGRNFTTNLSKQNDVSHAQRFISFHQDLQKSGVPESEVYEKAVEKYAEGNVNFQLSKRQSTSEQKRVPETGEKINTNVTDIFRE